MDEPIYILCATDDNYAPYCGIMLTSLFESNRDYNFSAYVLVNGDISTQNRQKYKMLEEKYGNKVYLVTMDESLFAKLPLDTEGTHSHITSPTYYRLMASSILPNEVKKCIYLDCDIIVCGDIKMLWDVDLTGKAIAGVKDCSFGRHQRRLGYSSNYDYINAGVSVYNLDYWRKNHVQERAFEYIRLHKDQLPLMDQDTINGLLYDQMVVVPPRYNFQTLFFERSYWEQYEEPFRKSLADECGHAIIIHYCTKLKPWNFRYSGGFCYSLWNRFRKISFWQDCRITNPKGKYVKHLVKRIMFPSVLMNQIEGMWVVLPETRQLFGFHS